MIRSNIVKRGVAVFACIILLNFLIQVTRKEKIIDFQNIPLETNIEDETQLVEAFKDGRSDEFLFLDDSTGVTYHISEKAGKFVFIFYR